MPGVLRDSRKPFGKARQKCIEMLEALGICVTTCTPAYGFWRSSIYADVYRWEFTGTVDGVSCVGGCWETMTKCAKAKGFTWNKKEMEVWPVFESPSPVEPATPAEARTDCEAKTI